MDLDSTATTRYRLEQWGRWAYTGRGLSIEHLSIEPFERMRGSTLKSAEITDDEGMKIDGAISEMSIYHPDQAEAVALYYLGAGNHVALSKAFRRIGKRVTRKRAGVLLDQGVMWLDAALR